MTTVLSLQEKSRCEATGQSMTQPQAGVCLTGKAGVRPNIDGLVTHTSKAGVRQQHLTLTARTVHLQQAAGA